MNLLSGQAFKHIYLLNKLLKKRAGSSPKVPIPHEKGIFIFSSLIQACILNDGFTDNYFEVNK